MGALVRAESDSEVGVTVVDFGAEATTVACDTALLITILFVDKVLLHITALGGAEMRQVLSMDDWKSLRDADINGVIVMSVELRTLSWEQELRSTSKTSSSEHGLLLPEKFEPPRLLRELNGDESNARVGLIHPRCTIVGGL